MQWGAQEQTAGSGWERAWAAMPRRAVAVALRGCRPEEMPPREASRWGRGRDAPPGAGGAAGGSRGVVGGGGGEAGGGARGAMHCGWTRPGEPSLQPAAVVSPHFLQKVITCHQSKYRLIYVKFSAERPPSPPGTGMARPGPLRAAAALHWTQGDKEIPLLRQGPASRAGGPSPRGHAPPVCSEKDAKSDAKR